MTKRERYLAMGVGVVVGLLGVQTLISSVSSRWQAKQDLVDSARADWESMQRIETAGTIAERQLQQLNVKSLPSKQESAVAEYKAWLTKAAFDAGVTDIKITPTERPIGSPKAYSEYQFGLTGVCRTDQWLDLMATYYDADYLHKLESVKVTMTNVPNVLQINFDSRVLALNGAEPNQPASGLSSGRLSKTVDEYKQVILDRNPFSPPNQAPTFAGPRSFEIPRDTPWEQILKTEDAENHEVTLSLDGDSLPEGLSLAGKTLKWTPTENGEFQFTLRTADNGWPSATHEEKLTLKVVDPPAPAETTPEPPKFDAATQAFVSGLVSGRAGSEVWIHSRTEGKTHELSVGSTFEIGSIKGKVISINLNEDFVELESDGKLWTVGMDTSLADAFAKSKID
ncbi:MAG: hypothetical protein KDA72_14460 [Planctomycetales bacterium]|nr:hypothetical protein [Planctomycetales bacterium]